MSEDRGLQCYKSGSVLMLSFFFLLIAKTGEGLCSIFSVSFVQWDAMTFFLESVVSPMFRFMEKDVCSLDVSFFPASAGLL